MNSTKLMNGTGDVFPFAECLRLDTDSEVIVAPKQRRVQKAVRSLVDGQSAEAFFQNAVEPEIVILGRALCWEETALQGNTEFKNISMMVVVGCGNPGRISRNVSKSLPSEYFHSGPRVMKMIPCKSPQLADSDALKIDDMKLEGGSMFVHVLLSSLVPIGHIAIPILLMTQLSIELFSRVK